MQKKYLFFLALIFIFSACSKDESPNIIEEIDYSYFPITVGHWVIYDADSVVIDEFTHDSTAKKFQLKEVIESVFFDNEGRETQRRERYRRENDSLPWELIKVYTSNLTSAWAETYEDNSRIISMVFPVKINQTWNGYGYIDKDSEELFEYTQVDETVELNGINYPNTSTVTQMNEENLIIKKYCVEKYAKNIGLVYKEFLKDSSSSQDLSTPLESRITGAARFKMTIVSYGSL